MCVLLIPDTSLHPTVALPDARSFSFSFSSRWHRSARKGPYALRPVSQQSPQGFPRNSANICLVEHRSFSTFEGGISAASFLHSSFFQAINAVMLWPMRGETTLVYEEPFNRLLGTSHETLQFAQPKRVLAPVRLFFLGCFLYQIRPGSSPYCPAFESVRRFWI